MEQLKSIPIIRRVIFSITLLCSVLHLRAQSDQVNNLAQFLFPEFSKGILKMKAGKDLVLMLNYNIVTEKMVFLQKGQVYDMLNQQNVDTALINSEKFVPVDKAFHEVVLEGPVKLYIQHKGTIQDPGKPVGYGGTSQVASSTYLTRIDLGGNGTSIFNMKLPDELVIKPEDIFWISFNSNKFSFINERQFLKIFPGKEGDIKKYIKQNHLKFENAEDVIRLAKYSYELIK